MFNSYKEFNYITEQKDIILLMLVNSLLNETGTLNDIVEYVTEILEENNLDIEIDCLELLENLEEVIESSLNESTGEEEYTVSKKWLEIYEAEDKKTFGQSFKDHIKRNRGRYIGAGIGAGAGALVAGKNKGVASVAGGALGAIVGRRVDKKRTKLNIKAGKHPDDYR